MRSRDQPARSRRSPLLPMTLLLAPLLAGCPPVDVEQPEDVTPRVFTFLTAEDNMTQGMALVLAHQAQDGDAQVRVLLCGPGAELAIEGQDGEVLEPRGVTPGELLEELIAREVVVEVCAIFVPNTEWTEDDLREGIAVAHPPEVAEHMQLPETKLFTF